MFPSTIRAALVTDGTPMRGVDPAVPTTSSRPAERGRAVAALLVGFLILLTACGGGPAQTTDVAEPTEPDATTTADEDPTDPDATTTNDDDPSQSETDESNGIEDALARTADLEVDRPAADSDDATALAMGFNAVGFDLFRAEAATSEQDVVISPLSIGLAFGMLDVGATGDTAAALDELFAYPVEGEARWSAFNTLDQRVVATRETGDGETMVVRVANRQFPDEAFEPVEGYDETIARYFGAGIEPLPIRADPAAARERINGWVSEQTEGRIPSLLPDSSPSTDSKVVLVDALYYEAAWAEPFDENDTKDAGFVRFDGSYTRLPTMVARGLPGRVSISEEYDAVAVPYADPAYELLVVAPAEGLYADVEARFRPGFVDAIDTDMRVFGDVLLELHLPRFESGTTLPLHELLEQDLGVTGLFDSPGGLAGIHEDLELGEAFHAATIEVDEGGTIGSAATALEAEFGGAPEAERDPFVIRVDRPFLYLIRHRPTGANLFVGRVLDPTA
jgi:serpin B